MFVFFWRAISQKFLKKTLRENFGQRNWDEFSENFEKIKILIIFPRSQSYERNIVFKKAIRVLKS